MTDLTALATKLAALISEDDVFAAGGARVISQGGDPPALVAILREVDDTVLERTLVFELENVTIRAVVAGRRLRGIVQFTGDVPGVRDIVGKVFNRDEPDVLAAAGKILTHVCGTSQRVTVRSGPPRELGSSSETGISATGLAEIWQVNMDARPAPPMERFVAGNATAMLGHIRLDGAKKIDDGGKTAPLQNIANNQLADFRKRYKALRAKQTGPTLICLDSAVGGKTSVVLATMGKESCLFSCEADKLPGLISSWYAITT